LCRDVDWCIYVLPLVFSDCSFLSKALTAYDAGAVAVVIKDSDNENSQFMIDMIDDGTARPVDIAAFFMFGKDGCVMLCFIPSQFCLSLASWHTGSGEPT